MSVTKLTSKKDQLGIEDSIVKDASGYYKITLGAFNTYNRSGIYYRIKRPKDLLEGNTILKRRITEGTLRSELDHPDYTNMGKNEIINRTITLDMKNTIAHIKAVEFVDTGRCEPGWDGYNITIVYGWVKPVGPYAEILQEQLDNPEENVAFSVRSLVKQSYVGTTLVRDVIDVSTWDSVKESGIKIASQWNAAGIESIVGNEDIGICVDGVCYNALKETLTANEDINCEDGKCMLDKVRALNEKPSILNW